MRAFVLTLAFVLVAHLPSVTGQQASDDIQKRLDEMMKRLEQQEKVIQSQGEKIQKQDERIQEQERIIQSLQKPGVKEPGGGGADTLTSKQEKKVQELVSEYLKKEDVRIDLGLEGVVAGYKDGFFLASRDQSYKMKFTGYIQLDGRFPDTPTASTFLIRRARPTVEGTLAKYYNFKLQPDFGMGKVTLMDAYMDLAYFGDLSTTRLGKFKVPQDIEYLMSSVYLPFIERALTVNLMPQRDVGVMMYGSPFGGILDYSFGVWNGDDRTEWTDKSKDSDTDNNKDKDFGGRLQLSPFKKSDNKWLKGVQLAGWFNYGREDDAYDLGKGKSVLNYTTGPGTTFFRTYSGTPGTNPAVDIYAVRQDGNRLRVGTDAVWLVGPLRLLSEFDVMDTGLTRQIGRAGPGNTPIFARENIPTSAWYVQAGWMLTGEENTLINLKPKKNFDPKKGTWGAFEVAARYSRLEIGSAMFDTHPGQLTPMFAAPGSAKRTSEITLGLNWYLNPNVKLMFDWDHYNFEGGGITVSPTSGIGPAHTNINSEDAFMFRSQILW
jgi:phosphate-selective porin OprO/OprP